MLSVLTLKQRALEISRKRRLSHVGSCLSCLPILVSIYSKQPDAVVILSNGHAGLALYCVLEAVFGLDAEDLLDRHGIHPCYSPEDHIFCSTGSLGMGLAVAAGYAMAGKNVQCILSDGECAEGVVWETLDAINAHDLPVTVHVNANGWSAYRHVDLLRLEHKLKAFLSSVRVWLTHNDPMPDSLVAHYEVPE